MNVDTTVRRSQPAAGGVRAWFEQGDAIVVPRRVSMADRVRLGLAVIVTLAALAFAGIGLASPGVFGIERGMMLLTGPALALAAVIHLYLVYTGVRRPLAVFSPRGVQILGYFFRPEQVSGVRVARSPSQVELGPALIVSTTTEQFPSIVAVPPGWMDERELNGLYARIRQRINSE